MTSIYNSSELTGAWTEPPELPCVTFGNNLTFDPVTPSLLTSASLISLGTLFILSFCKTIQLESSLVVPSSIAWLT